MRKYFWMFCVVSIGFLLAPCPSFSSQHLNIGCASCHDVSRDCFSCHNDESTRPEKTLEVATHSSAVIGSEAYGQWERECLDCHDPHNHNNLVRGPDGGIFDDSLKKADIRINYAVTSGTEVTFSLEAVTVHDDAWADPATWLEKSGPGRGLLLVMDYDPYQGYVWYEVIRTTVNSVTIGENYRMFPASDNPINAHLVYGMLIRDEVNGKSILFNGPSSMADDDSGVHTDTTPDGICQVCHTQTLHWRSDGTLADHFSGWTCTICHPHEEGFKVNPPPLSPCVEGPSLEWDCSGTWGGDGVLDNCGTCDNDPGNDCVMDCNGVWGGDGQWDACMVCDGDSTSCENDPTSPYYPVDRSGTVLWQLATAETVMWQQATADVNENGGWDTGDGLLYNDAVEYCNNLLFAGYTDWRMPNKDELKELVLCVDSSGVTTTETPLADGAYCGGAYVRPTIDQSIFDCAISIYWSKGPDRPWITHFLHGRTWISWDAPYYIRCVRDY